MSRKARQIQVRAVILLISIIPFYHTDLLTENYTGILNHGNRFLFLLCMTPLFFFLTLLSWRKRPDEVPLKTWRKQIGFTAALLLITFLFPYPETESWLSGMHVLTGTLAAGFMQLPVLAWIKDDRRLQRFYVLTLFLILLLIVTAGCINGLVEIIAVNAFSFLVTGEKKETFCDTLLHRKGISS